MLNNTSIPFGSGDTAPDTANADADADFAAALVGMLVNARLSMFSGADFVRPQVAPVSSINGEGAATHYYMRTAAALFGRDTSDSTMRAIEARSAGNASLSTVYRILVDSQTRVYDIVSSDFCLASGLPDLTGGNRQDSAGVLQARSRAYWASRMGRRYRAGSLDLTGIAAVTALVLTTPSWLLVAGATSELVVRRITASLPVVGAATSFRMLVKTDTADRFSAGGTTRTPETLNPGNAVASAVARSLELATATAEGAGTRGAGTKAGKLVAGGTIVMEYDDGLIVPAGGSLLVYLLTATAAGQCDLDVEFEEANIQ